eukprot:6876235-Heterocapsa_arctica.AAC.1
MACPWALPLYRRPVTAAPPPRSPGLALHAPGSPPARRPLHGPAPGAWARSTPLPRGGLPRAS